MTTQSEQILEELLILQHSFNDYKTSLNSIQVANKQGKSDFSHGALTKYL